MPYPVSYHCPRCETLHELEREGYLADRCVTPYPLEGWEYAAPDEPFEDGAADGVRLVCGNPDLLAADERDDRPDADEPEGAGCGEPFYLSFVRYENGEPVEPPRESEYVELAEGQGPWSPRGPRGPDGPTGPGRTR